MGGSFIMDFNIFFNLKTAIESSIFNVGLRKLFHHIECYYNTSWVFHLIWYYTTWTSTIYFHITIFVWNTYPEPVLDIWNYNMAYNLSGHSEPCDPHTTFSTLYITFLGTLDQGDPSSIFTISSEQHYMWFWNKCHLHLGTLNQEPG